MFRPGIIKDVIVRQDGSNELVGVGTVTLPDIENKAETITGLGTDEFEYIVDTAFNNLNLSLKFQGLSKHVKFSQGKVVNLVIKAVLGGVNDETHDDEIQVLTISCKGRVKKRSGGELGRATKNEPEVELALTYYKYEIDGEVITEIDKFNKITILDGEDIAARVKQALN